MGPETFSLDKAMDNMDITAKAEQSGGKPSTLESASKQHTFQQIEIGIRTMTEGSAKMGHAPEPAETPKEISPAEMSISPAALPTEQSEPSSSAESSPAMAA